MSDSLPDPNGYPPASSKDGKEHTFDLERLLAMRGFQLHSVALEGDIILDLDHGSIRVHSEVLTHASPVFKAMLGPNFSEGQGLRSVTSPKTIKLEDDDTESMLVLCVFLHRYLHGVHLSKLHQPAHLVNPTHVFKVAVLADKYDLVDHLKDDIVPTLLAPFIQRREAHKLDLLQALHLAVAAYLLRQSDLFTLFSRRLIMDYINHSLMFELTELFDHIPNTSILQLEDQHDFLRARINAAVDHASIRTCYMCGTDKYDFNLADTIAQNLKPKKDQWPPDYIGQHTLRGALIAFGSMEEYTAFKDDEYALCTRHRNQSYHKAEFFENTAQEISKTVEVLCYTCTREEKHHTKCEHKEELQKRMQELDPLFGSVTRGAMI